MFGYIFLFKQKTAYEMRISDWSSDVCSSDLAVIGHGAADGQQIAMEQPGGEQLADDEADAPRIAEIIHVAGAVRIDAREQRHRMAEFVEILPVDDDPRRARDRGQVDGMIGRAAGREQAYARVDDRLFVVAARERAIVVAVPADLGQPEIGRAHV